MQTLTFDQIPQVITDLRESVSRIEQLILEQSGRNPSPGFERLMRVKEAAEFLQLSPSTIYLKVSQREIPHLKRGKHLYFSKSDLLEYLEAGRKKTVSEMKNEALISQPKAKKGGRNE